MGLRDRERDIDNLLMEELTSDNPDETRIKSLVAQGADVCSIGKLGDSMLMEIVDIYPNGPDVKLVRLLIELGADVNYQTPDGYTAVGNSWFPANPRVTELLLQSGADPNVVMDRCLTPLGYAEADLWYEKNDTPGPGWESDPEARSLITNHEEIIRLLKEYGAVHFHELLTEDMEEYLHIFAGFPTGLCTKRGHIEIESIPGASDALCRDFDHWLSTDWDSLNKSWNARPADFDRQAHNATGLVLAKQIRALVDASIEVSYRFFDMDGELQSRCKANEVIL